MTRDSSRRTAPGRGDSRAIRPSTVLYDNLRDRRAARSRSRVRRPRPWRRTPCRRGPSSPAWRPAPQLARLVASRRGVVARNYDPALCSPRLRVRRCIGSGFGMVLTRSHGERGAGFALDRAEAGPLSCGALCHDFLNPRLSALCSLDCGAAALRAVRLSRDAGPFASHRRPALAHGHEPRDELQGALGVRHAGARLHDRVHRLPVETERARELRPRAVFLEVRRQFGQQRVPERRVPAGPQRPAAAVSPHSRPMSRSNVSTPAGSPGTGSAPSQNRNSSWWTLFMGRVRQVRCQHRARRATQPR